MLFLKGVHRLPHTTIRETVYKHNYLMQCVISEDGQLVTIDNRNMIAHIIRPGVQSAWHKLVRLHPLYP